MPEDIQLPKGPTRRSKPGGTGANPLLVPILGIVKDNVDPTRAGRIFVYLANNSGLDPNDRTSWRPVKLLSPFLVLQQVMLQQIIMGILKIILAVMACG